MLMAEQNFHQAIRIADRGYIIVHGEIVFGGGVRERARRERARPQILSGALKKHTFLPIALGEGACGSRTTQLPYLHCTVPGIATRQRCARSRLKSCRCLISTR